MTGTGVGVEELDVDELEVDDALGVGGAGGSGAGREAADDPQLREPLETGYEGELRGGVVALRWKNRVQRVRACDDQSRVREEPDGRPAQDR